MNGIQYAQFLKKCFIQKRRATMKRKSIYWLSTLIMALLMTGLVPWCVDSANGITLTSPNGGETLSSASICTIQWTAPPEAVSFKLKYSKDNGNSWNTIGGGITGSSNDWTVPAPTKTKQKCLVKVVGFNSKAAKVGADVSDAPFTILGEIATLQARVAALEEVLAHVSVYDGTINGVAGPHLIFTGVNVHVRNGCGGNCINGLGNLIVGYNEEPSDLGAGERHGSHNLIIGDRHRYLFCEGIVAGKNNTISGLYASVIGGYNNTASGESSSVSGGRNNTASGYWSSVSGGSSNTASG